MPIKQEKKTITVKKELADDNVVVVLDDEEEAVVKEEVEEAPGEVEELSMWNRFLADVSGDVEEAPGVKQETTAETQDVEEAKEAKVDKEEINSEVVMEGLRYRAQYLRRDRPGKAGHLYISSSRHADHKDFIALPHQELYMSCWDIIDGMFEVRVVDCSEAPRYWAPAEHILSTWTSSIRYVPDTDWNVSCSLASEK